MKSGFIIYTQFHLYFLLSCFFALADMDVQKREPDITATLYHITLFSARINVYSSSKFSGIIKARR